LSNEKPAEVKRLIGSRAYKPAPVVIALPQTIDTPQPERELGAAGMMLWTKAWRVGRMWISDISDADLLLMTCEQFDEREILREMVMDDPGAWRERAALRELEKSIRQALSLLGFTPTDRMKLGLAEVKKSALQELMEQKANGE
jgi:hypothetical protein